MEQKTLVLVHGAWHGAWVWADLVSVLNDAGVTTHVVDLPGVGRGPADAGHDLTAHASFLGREVAAVSGPTVVCAHSYGGVVATEGLSGLSSLVGLIFLAAFMLEPGESGTEAAGLAASLADLSGPVLAPTLEGHHLSVPPEIAGPVFYEDLDEAARLPLLARLTPEHVGAFTTPVTRAAWQEVPTRYIVTTRDRALPAGFQRRMAARATSQSSIDSDHSPMVSHPRELAAVLLDAMASADQTFPGQG